VLKGGFCFGNDNSLLLSSNSHYSNIKTNYIMRKEPLKIITCKTVFACALITALLLTSALCTDVSAKKYFVGISTPWTTADGESYTAATAENLTTAVNAARLNPGVDTIYVGVGRYYLGEELDLSDILLGGYPASAVSDTSRLYPASADAGNGSDLSKMTILDGNSFRTTVDNALNSLKHRVATVNTGGVIEGCMIRNGHARSTTTTASSVNHGGGVLLKGGAIYNCILRGNVAFNPAGSSFSYNSSTPSASVWTTSAPAKGGGVYIDVQGGDVVNCLIYSNMDDLGLGIDYNSSASGAINIINNTVVNNAICPRMASLINTDGFGIINQYSDMTEKTTTPYTLSRYYMANTETTAGQYSCFLNAIEVTISGSNVLISADDLSAILSAYAPLSGHANQTVWSVLSIGTNVNTTASSWVLCSFTTDATNAYGRVYRSSASGIFAPNRAATVEPGENVHNNRYGCGYISWYGGMTYSIWMGGMLPTVGQWYYAALATDNNGGKAPNSHYPSPVVKTSSPSGSSVSDTDLEAIGWYDYNSGGHVHEVAKKAPNSVGLYDMSGNLWEWQLDWAQSGAYTGGQDGVCVASVSYRYNRGGSHGSVPLANSVDGRGSDTPATRENAYGCRLAVAAP
jgi:formylglycine-generating enzyme required for sulfatase activity